MTRYCQEAAQYGDQIQPASKPFSKVLVVLNPVADKRSAAKAVSLHISHLTVYSDFQFFFIIIFIVR